MPEIKERVLEQLARADPVHYKNISESYHQAFFYENDSDYQQWQLELISSHLRLKPTDRVADIGCGTGAFSSLLATQAGLIENILAVEQCAEMLDHAKALPNVTQYCADALSFARERTIRNDKVLMKEMIHHIPVNDLSPLYRALHEQICKNGSLVTVTRPAIVDYPFFQSAFVEWEKHTYSADLLTEKMADAGFRVSNQTYSYLVKITKHRWFEMIRNRFWSTFSCFDDEQLENGLAELATKYEKTDELHFNESLIIIEATK